MVKFCAVPYKYGFEDIAHVDYVVAYFACPD